MVLVKFSKTLKGKFLLLLLTIVITLYNKTGGIVMAMLLIFLSEFNYEVNNGILYEGFTGASEAGAATNNKNKKKTTTLPAPDQLTVMEQLKARSS